MSFFSTSQAEKFTPKEIKFSQLYKTGTGGGKPSSSLLNKAREVLAKAGYNEKKISQMITEDAKIPVNQMKEVAILMNKSGVYGFYGSPENQVKELLNKERVKAQNIAKIRREHIMEAYQEDLDSYSATTTTSLNSRGKGPNNTKSTTDRRSPIKSLSNNYNSSVTSSLSAQASRGGSLGGRNMGTTFKPKY